MTTANDAVRRLTAEIGFPPHVVNKMWSAARSETNARFAGKPVAKQVLDDHALALFSVSFDQSFSYTLPQWFVDLTKRAKAQYVKLNAAGRIAKAYLGQKVGELKKAPETVARAAHIHYRRNKLKMRRELVKHGKGLSTIKDLMLGKRVVSESEREQAKDTAKFAGKILLGGMLAAGLFFGLGPFIHVIGVEFFGDLVSKSSVPEDADTATVADELLDNMYAWISKDPEKLEEFLKAKYGDEPSFEE